VRRGGWRELRGKGCSYDGIKTTIIPLLEGVVWHDDPIAVSPKIRIEVFLYHYRRISTF
jgi:hypothetical protein